MNKTLDMIHENIGYEQFKQTYPGDIGLIDEFVNVMLDVLLSEGGVIRIYGVVKSRELVQSQLVKLEYADVVYSIHAVSITLGEKRTLYKLGTVK